MDEIFPMLVCDKIYEYLDYWNDKRRLGNYWYGCSHALITFTIEEEREIANGGSIDLLHPIAFEKTLCSVTKDTKCKCQTRSLFADNNKKEFYYLNPDLVTIDRCIRCEKLNFGGRYKTSKEIREMRDKYLICTYCMPILHRERTNRIERRITRIEDMLKDIIKALATRKIYV